MIETPFNYTGSKYKLLEQILPKFDYSKPYFLDLFCGGGSVYTNILDKYEKIWANDIIKNLVEIHYSLVNDESFVERVKLLCPAKDDQSLYHVLRDSYNSEKSPEKLFALMLSCTNNMMRFNKSFYFNQTFGKRTFNKNTELKINKWVEHVEKFKNKLYYTSLDFSSVYPLDLSKTFIYCDPPYYQTEAGYNAYWSVEKEINLSNYLNKADKAGATFAVSGVLCDEKSPLLESLIESKYKVHYLEFDYEKVARKKNKDYKEVLITNY